MLTSHLLFLQKTLTDEKQRLLKPMRDWNAANVKLGASLLVSISTSSPDVAFFVFFAENKQNSLRLEMGKPTGDDKRAKLRTIMAALTGKRVRYSLEYKVRQL